MENQRLTFPKAEHIVSQKQIDELFGKADSSSLAAFPVRIIYKMIDGPAPASRPVQAQVLLSVPKKRLHHAVDRNRVKRQLREAWRHRRQPLLDAVPADKHLLVAILWLSDRLYESAQVSACVGKLVRRMAEKL